MKKIFSISTAFVFVAGLAGLSRGQDFNRSLADFQAQAAVCAAARAQNQQLTWEQIEARYIPDWPVMAFEGQTMPIVDLCHVGGKSFELRGAKKTVDVCRDSGYDERRCLRSESVRVSIPAVIEYEDCPDAYDRRDRCANPVKASFTRPLTYQVSVYVRGVDEDRVALFTKTYTIPACK